MSAIPTPWLHQDTTPMAVSGPGADDPQPPGAPRPASGQSPEGRDALQQVLLRLGGSGEGGLPLRGGRRDGNRRESVEPPVALAEGQALGVEGGRGLVSSVIPSQG